MGSSSLCLSPHVSFYILDILSGFLGSTGRCRCDTQYGYKVEAWGHGHRLLQTPQSKPDTGEAAPNCEVLQPFLDSWISHFSLDLLVYLCPYKQNKLFSLHLLAPKHVVRREVMFSVCAPPGGGTLGQGSFPGLWCHFLSGMGVPQSWTGVPQDKVPPARSGWGNPLSWSGWGTATETEQQSEQLLRGGWYASYVHTGGLSC